MDTKKCSKCKIIKLKADFYQRSDQNGLYSWCKRCLNDKRASYHVKANPEKRKKYITNYLTNPKNYLKTKARIKFRLALKKGIIVRPKKCSYKDCLNGKVEGHHFDYSKPLKVIWLCKKHHKMIERKHF